MSNFPEFFEMSKTEKVALTQRFRPEHCPKCGRALDDKTEVLELISSIPCWIVSCFCGAEYNLKIYNVRGKG